jgi:hypothetical protein
MPDADGASGWSNVPVEPPYVKSGMAFRESLFAPAMRSLVVAADAVCALEHALALVRRVMGRRLAVRKPDCCRPDGE